MLNAWEVFLICFLKMIWVIKRLPANVEFTVLFYTGFSSQVLFLPSGQRPCNSWQSCILYSKMVCVCVCVAVFSLFLFCFAITLATGRLSVSV